MNVKKPLAVLAVAVAAALLIGAAGVQQQAEPGLTTASAVAAGDTPWT